MTAARLPSRCGEWRGGGGGGGGGGSPSRARVSNVIGGASLVTAITQFLAFLIVLLAGTSGLHVAGANSTATTTTTTTSGDGPCYSYYADSVRFAGCDDAIATSSNKYPRITFDVPHCSGRLIDIRNELLAANDTDVMRALASNLDDDNGDDDDNGSSGEPYILKKMLVDGVHGCMRDCNGVCFDDIDCAPHGGTGSQESCLGMFGNGVCNDGFLSQLANGAAWHVSRRLSFNCREWAYDGGDCESTAVATAAEEDAPASDEECWAHLPSEDDELPVLTAEMAREFARCPSTSMRGFCFADCRGTCFNLNSTVAVVSSGSAAAPTTVLARALFGDSECDRGQRGLDLSCVQMSHDAGDCLEPGSTGTAAVDDGDIHLLALHPMDGLWEGGATTKPGVDLAVHLINSRKPGWDAGLPPGYSLKLHWRDSKCDSSVGWKEYLDFYDDPSMSRVAGIIGCGCSDVCQSVNRHATIRNLPQVSYGCTSPALFGNEEHRLFASLHGTETAQIEAWLELCIRFNWTRVATVHDYDHLLFTAPVNEFKEKADGYDIQVSSKSFSGQSCRDEIRYDGLNDESYVPFCFQTLLDELAEEGLVVVFYLMYEDMMLHMFEAVYERHEAILQTSGRVWMGPGWYSKPPSEWTHKALLGGGAYSYAIREVFEPEGEKRGIGHDAYWEEFVQLYPNWNTAGFTSLPSTQSCLAVDDASASQVIASPRKFNTTDLFGFDSVFIFASAFARILNETEDARALFDGALVMETILDHEERVDGVSGKMAFSGEGIRLLDYTLVNVQPSAEDAVCNQTGWEYKEVGTFTTSFVAHNSSGMHLSDDVLWHQLRFYGGLHTSYIASNGFVYDTGTVSSDYISYDTCQRVQAWNNSVHALWEPSTALATWPLDYNRICESGNYFEKAAGHCTDCVNADTACMHGIEIPCILLDDTSTQCTSEGVFARPDFWLDENGYDALVSTVHSEPTESLQEKGLFFAQQVNNFLYECRPTLCIGNTNKTCNGVYRRHPHPFAEPSKTTVSEVRKCVCHHRGVLCSECEPGYVKSLGSCQDCANSSKRGFAYGLVFTALALVAFALFILVYSGEASVGNGTLKITVFFIHITSLLVAQVDESLLSIFNVITFDFEEESDATTYTRPTSCYYGYFPASRVFIAKIILSALVVVMCVLTAVGQLYYIRKYSFKTFTYYQLIILSIIPNLLDRLLVMWYRAFDAVSTKVQNAVHRTGLYTRYMQLMSKKANVSTHNAWNTEPSLVIIRDGKIRRFARSRVAHIIGTGGVSTDATRDGHYETHSSSPSYKEIFSRRRSKVFDDSEESMARHRVEQHQLASSSVEDDIEQQTRIDRIHAIDRSLENASVKYQHTKPMDASDKDNAKANDDHDDGSGDVRARGNIVSEDASVVRTFVNFKSVVAATEKIRKAAKSTEEGRRSIMHKDDRLAYMTVATILDGIPFVLSNIKGFFKSLGKPTESGRSYWKNVTIGNRDSKKDKKHVAATFSHMMANAYTYLFFPSLTLVGEMLTCREVKVNGQSSNRLVYDPAVECDRTFFSDTKDGSSHQTVFILACVLLCVLFGFTWAIFRGVQRTITARTEAIEERKHRNDGPKIRHWTSMQQRYGSIILRYKPGLWFTNMYFVELTRDVVMAMVFTTFHSSQVRIFGCAWVLALFGMNHCLVWPYVELQDNVLMSLAYFFLFVVTFCLESESMSTSSAFRIAQLLFWLFMVIAFLFIYFCSSFERFRSLLEFLNAYTAYDKRRKKRNYKIVMRVHPDLRCTVSWGINFEKRIEQNMSVLPPLWGFVVNELFCFSHKVIRREKLKRKGTPDAIKEADGIVAELHGLGYTFHEYQLHVLCTSSDVKGLNADGDGDGPPRWAPQNFIDEMPKSAQRIGDEGGVRGGGGSSDWLLLYPNEDSVRQGVLHGSSTNCTFKKMFNGLRKGTFILRLRVFDVGTLSALDHSGLTQQPNRELIKQSFFEFDLETFDACEVSRRLPEIHFGNPKGFVDLDSANEALYDVVKYSNVTSDGNEQSTIIFNKRDGAVSE